MVYKSSSIDPSNIVTSVSISAGNTGLDVSGSPITNSGTITLDSETPGLTDVSDLLATTEFVANSRSPNPSYFFHGFAGKQINGDPVFYDISGSQDNGTFGANLTNLNAWSNDFYVSTVTPTGGSTDSVIRMPALNFDYSGGEKLILWWLGIIGTPGGNASMMGDGINGTYHGVRIRANTTSKFQLALYDSTNSSGLFGGASTGTPFDGTLHSFAFVLDGETKKYGMWVDEVYDSAFSGAYSTYGSGTDVDTKTTNTFNIGAAAPAVAASTDGIVTLTRSLAILRLSSSATTPSVITMTNIFKQLRANPSNLVLGSAF